MEQKGLKIWEDMVVYGEEARKYFSVLPGQPAFEVTGQYCDMVYDYLPPSGYCRIEIPLDIQN